MKEDNKEVPQDPVDIVDTDDEIVPEPEFVPPEVAAAEDQALEENSPVKESDTSPKPPKKASWWKRTPRKKKLLILIPAGVVLVGAIVAAVLLLTHKKAPVAAPVAAPVVQKKVEPPKPTTVASKLTGVQVEPALNARGVTGVMIENSIDARPQSGLLDAGVVYEAIAEGGITRFLALYQTEQPDYIGPVRSARPYYVKWLLPYNAAYMHIGGSGEALNMINNYGIRDMGENGANNPIQRITSRYAPHNAYTSMAKMDAVQASRGWGALDFPSLVRKAEAPSKAQTAITIDFAISSSSFYVHYDYNATTNSYQRSEGGSPHIDEKSGKQLSPKVVVALVIPYSINADDIHSDYASVGTGQAFVFQDGVVADVRWSKPANDAPLVITDANGAALPLNPGQTWFTAVGTPGMVTFKAPVVAPVTAP